MARQLLIILNRQQSQQDAADEIHALGVAPTAQVYIRHQDSSQLRKVFRHCLGSLHVFVDGLNFPLWQGLHRWEFFKVFVCQLLHFFGIRKHFPYVLADLIVNALEDRKIEIFLWVSREIWSLNNFSPFLESELPALATLANQQKIFDVHILNALLFLLLVLCSEDDEVVARWFFEDVFEDELKAVGLDGWWRAGIGVGFGMDEVGLELFEEVHYWLLKILVV